MAARSTIQTAASLPARSIEFEQECVRFFEEVVQVFGVPKSVGQIYGLLYSSPVPLSFSDVVERLEISKGSVSQGLQVLRSLGAIKNADIELKAASNKRETHFAGEKQVLPADRELTALGLELNARDATRRVNYEPELSLRQLVTGVLRERIAPMASTGGERLKRLKELASQSPAHADFYLERASQLTTWRRRFTTVLPLLTTLLGPKKKSAKK